MYLCIYVLVINCECHRFETNTNYEPFLHNFRNVQIEFAVFENVPICDDYKRIFSNVRFSFLPPFLLVLTLFSLYSHFSILFLLTQSVHCELRFYTERFNSAPHTIRWWTFNFELFALVYTVKTPFKLNTFSTQSICFGFEIQCRKKPLNELSVSERKRKTHTHTHRVTIDCRCPTRRERYKVHTGWAF